MNPDNLFDYLEMVCSRNSVWASVKKSNKTNHHFMLHRYLSIQYPINANEMNRIGVNAESSAEYWHFLLGKLHNQIPKWMYTKTKKTPKDKDKYVPSKEVQAFWMKLNLTNIRDYEQMMQFYQDEFLEELKELETQLKLMQ